MEVEAAPTYRNAFSGEIVHLGRFIRNVTMAAKFSANTLFSKTVHLVGTQRYLRNEHKDTTRSRNGQRLNAFGTGEQLRMVSEGVQAIKQIMKGPGISSLGQLKTSTL